MEQDEELQQRQVALGQELRVRRKLGLTWWGSVVLIGLMVGLMLGRLLDSPEPAPSPTQVRVTVASWQGPQLQLDREPVWQRSDQAGAVSLLLPGTQLQGEAVRGALEQGSQRGSWRVQQSPRGVEVLVVSLAGELDVQLLPEQQGRLWNLAVKVRLFGD